ncbi:hypothetical protein SUGI_0372430 [Cryptomeria japonica]|nr:hypothetical protein SUGI_0372430 [Cryptomeria japonica]
MVGYNMHTDLKISEVASSFQVEPVALLGVNGIDVSYPDIENQILPTKYFVRVPVTCNCVNSLRQCSSVTYKVRASDTLYNIANSVFGGLVTAEQVRVVNSISDPNLIDLGQSLTIPLPCSCFNGTDNGLPAIYLSYVVQPGDMLAGLGVKYGTTVTDLMTVNALGATAIKAGDIIVVPLAATPTYKNLTSTTAVIWRNGPVTDLMTVNALGTAAIKAGDIIVVPLAATPTYKNLTSTTAVIWRNGSVTDLMTVNALGTAAIKAGDIIAVPLAARSKRVTIEGLDALSSLTQLRSVRLEKLDVPTILEQIKVIQKLDKLSLSLCEGFGNISTFSNTNLQEFNLDHCSDLEEWPTDICPLIELPASIGKLGLLEFLDISLCEGLKELPEEIGQLKQLKEFDMRECSRLRRLPKSVCELSSLKHVICDEKIGHLWLQVKASFVPDLRVEIVEPQFTLDWLDDRFHKVETPTNLTTL